MNMAKDMTGNATGAALGFYIGGMPGSIIGAASTPFLVGVLDRLGGEFKKRLLAPREQKRIGTVVTYTIDNIRLKLEKGEEVRQDDFFASHELNRSAADEIAEGVMLVSQREYEEKKIKYYGIALANLSFKKNQHIGREEANALLKVAENISYREICILAMAGALTRKIYDRDKLKDNYRGRSRFDTKLLILLHEIFNLYKLGMLTFDGDAALGLSDVKPSKIVLQGVGAHLYSLMELWEMSSDLYMNELALLEQSPIY